MPLTPLRRPVLVSGSCGEVYLSGFRFGKSVLFSAICLFTTILLIGCGSPSVKISASSFDFGTIAVNTHLRRVVVTISNDTAADVPLSPTLNGSIQSAISRGGSCKESVVAGSACTVVLTFAPTAAGDQSGSLDLNMTGPGAPADQTVALAGTAVTLAPGESLLMATANPLVALYSYHPASIGKIWVDFGTTSSYGLKTAVYPVPTSGTASIYVAGMRANTEYHMRASVQLSDGSVITDSDHTFTTSSFPTEILPTLTTTTNGTPQAGIELLDATGGKASNYLQAFATDLQGNVIWGYNYADRGKNTIIQPIKLLPNGHFLLTASYASQALVDGIPEGEIVEVREIDLAGNPVREISADEVNTRLAAAGYNVSIQDIHHDIAVLPNGHWILLCNTLRNVSGTPVLGDVLVDLDQSLKPVWVWNEFDHLDVNRRPTSFPDWTHSNAALYTGDGNLLVSIRHQSWIVKVNYKNGTGDGSVIWKLGQDGDFKLTNGADPGDWFAGEHQPAFTSPATFGIFSLTMMDNGFNRNISSNAYCGSGTACYTAVPILSIDENAMTATYTFRYVLPPSQYSAWGGGTTVLANGNLEFDLSAQGEKGANSEVDELKITGPSTAETVWQMRSTGLNFYRANRIPSLYPGVQW